MGSRRGIVWLRSSSDWGSFELAILQSDYKFAGSHRIGTHNCVIPSGLRSCCRSLRAFPSLCVVPFDSDVGPSSIAIPSLAAFSSAGVANIEADSRSPMLGKGIMPRGNL